MFSYLSACKVLMQLIKLKLQTSRNFVSKVFLYSVNYYSSVCSLNLETSEWYLLLHKIKPSFYTCCLLVCPNLGFVGTALDLRPGARCGSVKVPHTTVNPARSTEWPNLGFCNLLECANVKGDGKGNAKCKVYVGSLSKSFSQRCLHRDNPLSHTAALRASSAKFHFGRKLLLLPLSFLLLIPAMEAIAKKVISQATCTLV